MHTILSQFVHREADARSLIGTEEQSASQLHSVVMCIG